MRKTNLMLLLFLIGGLHPATVVAEDAGLAVTATSMDLAQPEYGYASRWRLSYALEEMAFSSDASSVITDIDFQDRGTFARVSKVRELSLLTLAEVGRTRLFLGVSEKGLLGFHLGALPRLGDERCLEFARMPYLKNHEKNDGAD